MFLLSFSRNVKHASFNAKTSLYIPYIMMTLPHYQNLCYNLHMYRGSIWYDNAYSMTKTDIWSLNYIYILYILNSPHKGQWRGGLMFSLICAWIHGWVNNRDIGHLGRHRAHYDVIVMVSFHIFFRVNFDAYIYIEFSGWNNILWG